MTNIECNKTYLLGRCALEARPQTKKCSTCKQIKLVSQFYKNKSASDGLYSNCKNCHIKATRKYDATTKGYQNRLLINRRLYHRYPERARARNLLRRAVFQGKIVKPATCSQCGNNGQLHGHHSDYSKPFEVEWLCPKCHRKIAI